MAEKKEYRSLPFWSWNDKLEKNKLIEQIHWMHDNGIGGFFMHARSGLQTEYLSEEWMECIDACVNEAKRIDMKAWVYDENGWPSGFVGGKLLDNKENCDKYILVEAGEYDSKADISYRMTETTLERVLNSQEITDKENYLNLYIHTAVSTVDILNPEVVDQFLELTHEKYKERYGEKFSEYIEGFFTDEPQYQRWRTPYTDMVKKYWEEQYDKDIFDELGLLFVEKEGYRGFRYKYWKAMQHLMLKNFAKRVYSWCDENNVKLTGHYIEEKTMGHQLMCCGGVMPFYEYEHIPGIDWLGKGTKRPLAAKQVGSAAAQLGKKQVITETFGCCGWDVSPIELKRILSFQYVNGVNLLCQHLIPFTERGSRKYDHPAHYSIINPWVKEEFKTFNDYYTELGYLLGEGESFVNVAMLHPMRSAYFDYKRELGEEKGFGISALDDKLLETCKLMAKRGIEYHFLDETLLEKYGYIEEEKIGCGRCKYDYLILPTLYTMDKTTEKLLCQYVKQGGKILLLDEKPAYLEGELYEYSYLESNTTLEEISSVQKYRVLDYNTSIYITYRFFEEKEYVYLMNSSETETYTQTVCFNSTEKQFVVTLKPGEDILICNSDAVACEQNLTPYCMKFSEASIDVKKNYLVVDSVRCSKDGEKFSELIPVPAMFNKLLQEQHCGELYLKYEFDVQEIPEKIYLRAEKSNDIAAWMNGKVLAPEIGEEEYVVYYDVTKDVHVGRNEYTIKVNWYQNENVFYALFGENVTESLKNCLVYDTELQPIELIGKFGVYPASGYEDDIEERIVIGKDFYIGKLPAQIEKEPVTEGFPFLSEEMTLKQKVTFDTNKILLQIPGDYHIAYVYVNNIFAGKLFFESELDISGQANVGENDIEVKFVLSNRNRMGPHHVIAGKRDIVSPWSFEFGGEWKDTVCDSYHEEFDLKKFYGN